MNITELSNSALGMVRELASSTITNVTWLSRQVCTALNGGLSRAAGNAASVWRSTSPHLSNAAGKAATPQGLLIGGAILLVAGVITYRKVVIQKISSIIEKIFGSRQRTRIVGVQTNPTYDRTMDELKNGITLRTAAQIATHIPGANVNTNGSDQQDTPEGGGTPEQAAVQHQDDDMEPIYPVHRLGYTPFSTRF